MELVLHPNPILRVHAVPVHRVGRSERRLLKGMLKHMRRWKGIGLAAPQVAHFEQLIVAEADGQTLQWVNPTILEGSGTERMEEGCLSIPGSFVDVVRTRRVRVRALDIEGRTVERELDGLLARVVQHEIDHLNGRLIIDHGPVIRHSLPRQGDA